MTPEDKVILTEFIKDLHEILAQYQQPEGTRSLAAIIRINEFREEWGL